MSANQGLYQVQKQTQSLVMAPQMRQSLKILQIPAMELRTAILEELQTNPVLEEVSSADITLESKEASSEDVKSSSDEGEMDFKEETYDIFKKLGSDWDEYFSDDGTNALLPVSQEKKDYFLNSLVSEVSLEDHLMDQAKFSECTEDELQALQYIIGSLDDKGFLPVTIDEIVKNISLSKEVVVKSLNRLKSFEPHGIGCVDLQECLLHQLKLKEKDDEYEDSLAVRIIRDYYKLLLRRRIPELSRELDVDISKIQSTIEIIAQLNPAPASGFSQDTNASVAPDVNIYKEGDAWIVSMCSDYIPKLRLSQVYKKMITDSKVSVSEKEYIKDKIRSGKYLMNAIDQRQQTIEKIAHRLIEYQLDFF